MREIKFRAWDKVIKTIYDVIGISWLVKNVTVRNVDTGYMVDIPIAEAQLMQYTGLDDVNGVEIYEGDIVEVKYSGNDDYRGNAQVIFKNGSFELVGKIVDIINQEAIVYDDFYSYTNELGKCSSNCTVIGNKFKNPELLEGIE